MSELETLAESIKKLHAKLRNDVKAKWKRVLPFDELLFDRWEKARYLGFGKKASIYHNSYVYGDVEIGEGTWVGPFTILDGSGGKLKIGRYCSISAGVQIYTHNTVKWALSGGLAPYERAPTTIGDCCYIGPYTVISMGVMVGNHCLIGAHSFLNRDLPSYSIAIGVPAKVVGKVVVKESEVKLIYEGQSLPDG
ncbi:MAG: acyltransferase [Candidatus Bathyarchaeia archaeon]